MSSRLKFGVYSGHMGDNGIPIKEKSLGIYREGMVSRDRIEQEIIPIIKEKDFPVVICSYFSQYPPSKSKIGIDIITTKTGPRFKPKRPKRDTESCDWFIDKDKNIIKIERE